MNYFIPILSISRPARQALALLPIEATLLGVFHRVINLIFGDEIIALVTPSIGNGAFHIVLEYLPTPKALSDDGSHITISSHPHGYQFGNACLVYSPSTIEVWEARPNWEALRKGDRIALLQKIHLLIEWLAKQLQENPSPFSRVIFNEYPFILKQLMEGLLKKDFEKIKYSVKEITGRGIGLTPSGDDFLAGVMLALHLCIDDNQTREKFCFTIVQQCIDKTTKLSLAFLKASYQGLADERWHGFLFDLVYGDVEPLKKSVSTILTYGASSGWDMLNGFIWVLSFAFNEII